MTTLVVGARGSVGRQVLEHLLAAGEPVRASARNPAAADLPAEVELVGADLTDPRSLRAALDGMSRVFLYTHFGGVAGFVDAARDAGVQHVVLLSSGSVLLPQARGNAIAEECRQVEQVLAGSGLSCTPVRPLVLANNASGWAHSIRREGVVRMAYPAAVTAPIHERDVAAVAVAALLRPGTVGLSGLLTGGEQLSQRAQVELIGAAIDKQVHVQEQSPAQAQTHLSRFMPAETAEAVLQLQASAAEGGSPVASTFRDVTGRAPTPFARWVRDHIAEFA